MEVGSHVIRSGRSRVVLAVAGIFGLATIAALCSWASGRPVSSHKEATFLAAFGQACGGDDTGVFVCQRDVLPKLPLAARGDVYYAEAPLAGNEVLAQLGFFHSGITVVLKDAPNEFPRKMTLQWYALQGLSAALLPQVGPEGPVWHNEAKVVYTPDIDEKYWVKQTLVAEDVSGHVLNRLLDFSVKYGGEHPYYQLFNVQQSREVDGKTQLGPVLVEDFVCDSFTRDAIFQMQSDGAKIVVTSFRYNIMRLFASKAFRVDNRPDTMQQIESFFMRLKKIMVSAQAAVAVFQGGDKAKTAEMVQLVQSGLASLGEDRIFIGSPATGFYEVIISKPFFNAGSVWIDVNTHEPMSAPK